MLISMHLVQAQRSAKGSPPLEMRALRFLEMLLAAGNRPMVYTNIRAAPGTHRVGGYNPLKEQARLFDLGGANK